MSFKIYNSRLQPHLPAANDLLLHAFSPCWVATPNDCHCVYGGPFRISMVVVYVVLPISLGVSEQQPIGVWENTSHLPTAIANVTKESVKTTSI